jgi:hypothetical protein
MRRSPAPCASLRLWLIASFPVASGAAPRFVIAHRKNSESLAGSDDVAPRLSCRVLPKGLALLWRSHTTVRDNAAALIAGALSRRNSVSLPGALISAGNAPSGGGTSGAMVKLRLNVFGPRD